MRVKAVPEERNIVLVGRWNVAIFTPVWLVRNFASTPEIEVLFPIGASAPSLRFGFDGTYLAVSSDRIIVFAKDLTPESFDKCASVAAKIVNTLVHTPMSAAGFNFTYVVEDPGAIQLKQFDLSSNGSLSDIGADISETSISQSVLIKDQKINISAKFEKSTALMTMQFNFHRDIIDCSEAQAFLSTPARDMVSMVNMLLEKVFGISKEFYEN